jgi:hypothetical protein
MHKRSSIKLESKELVQYSSKHMDKNIENVLPQKQKNPAAVALGRLGGVKGGKARAVVLSAKERSEIARKAAKARWQK